MPAHQTGTETRQRADTMHTAKTCANLLKLWPIFKVYAPPPRTDAGIGSSRGLETPREAASGQATVNTLLPVLMEFPTPQSLTSREAQIVRSLLDKYHPGFLTDSPVNDINGRPIQVRYRPNPKSGFSDDISNQLISIISNYSGHLAWMDEHLQVKEIDPSEVPDHERALIGQEGVFSKTEIRKDAVIGFFDGMLIENRHAAKRDKSIRKLAGCAKYSGPASSGWGSSFHGMGMTMKLNTATILEDGRYLIMPNSDRINVKSNFTTLHRAEDSGTLLMVFFTTNRLVRGGEQLCYNYACDSFNGKPVELKWSNRA